MSHGKSLPWSKIASIVMLSLFSTVLPGCSGNDRPPLGDVSGMVLMDGEPLANARVMVRHDEGGRPARGYTDESGHYRLAYKTMPDIEYGCKVGPSTVYVSTELDDDEPGGPQEESVPDCYRGRDSNIKVMIKDGTMTLDLPLTGDCSYSISP